MHTVLAWFCSLAGLASCFASVDALRTQGILSQRNCRKATHIGGSSSFALICMLKQSKLELIWPDLGHAAGTGLVYLCFWPLYPLGPVSKYVCASVPGLASLYFFLVGTGLVQDAGLLNRSTVRPCSIMPHTNAL